MAIKISNGRYVAEVIESCISKSKTNSISVKFLFDVLHNVKTPETPENCQIYGDLWLTENAFENSMKTLVEVFGFSGIEMGLLNNKQYFAGIQCEIVVENEEFTDEKGTRLIPKVKFINAVGSFQGLRSINEEELIPMLESLNSRLFDFQTKHQNVKPINKGIEVQSAYQQQTQQTNNKMPWDD